MGDDGVIFNEELAKDLKEGLSHIDKEYQEFFGKIKDRLPPDIRKLVFKKITRSNFEVYNFMFELVSAELGADEAERLFRAR